MILKNGKRLDGCSDTVPVGTLNPFLGSVAPYGYLICEGQLVSKTTYKELYKICGDKFGEGTETEFRLPDLRGKTIAGYKEGDTLFGVLGKLIGSENHNHDISHTHGVPGVAHTHSYAHTHGIPGVAHTHTTGNHTLTVAEMPSHRHDDLYGNNGARRGAGWGTGTEHTGTINEMTITDWESLHTGYTGGGGAHNHGNTGSTTPSATTTNSQSTSTSGSTTPSATTTNSQSATTSGNASNIQPTVVMNWIIKAFLLMPNQSYVENSLTSVSEINALSAAKGKELHTRLSSIENRLVVNSGNLVITPSVDVTKDYSTVSSSYLSYQASIAHPWIDYDCYASEPRYFRLRVGYKQNSNYKEPWRDIAIGRNGGDTWSYRIGFSSNDITINGDYSIYEKYFTINSSQTLNNVIVFLWEHVTCGCTIKYIELCEMKYIS